MEMDATERNRQLRQRNDRVQYTRQVERECQPIGYDSERLKHTLTAVVAGLFIGRGIRNIRGR